MKKIMNTSMRTHQNSIIIKLIFSEVSEKIILSEASLTRSRRISLKETLRFALKNRVSLRVSGSEIHRPLIKLKQ